MPRKKPNPTGGRGGKKKKAPQTRSSRGRAPSRSTGRAPADAAATDLTRRELLQWLVGLALDDIHAVLMAVGRDPEVEELDLHGGPEELVAQLEGSRPRLEALIAAIDDALGIDETALVRQVRGEFESEPEMDLDEFETGFDDELGLGPGEDEFEL